MPDSSVGTVHTPTLTSLYLPGAAGGSGSPSRLEPTGPLLQPPSRTSVWTGGRAIGPCGQDLRMGTSVPAAQGLVGGGVSRWRVSTSQAWSSQSGRGPGVMASSRPRTRADLRAVMSGDTTHLRWPGTSSGISPCSGCPRWPLRSLWQRRKLLTGRFGCCPARDRRS